MVNSNNDMLTQSLSSSILPIFLILLLSTLASIIISNKLSSNTKYSAIIKSFITLFDIYIDTICMIVLITHISPTITSIDIKTSPTTTASKNTFYFSCVFALSLVITLAINMVITCIIIAKQYKKFHLYFKKHMIAFVVIRILALFDSSLLFIVQSNVFDSQFAKALTIETLSYAVWAYI